MMNYIEIGGRKIGAKHPPLIIAEIGINHGGCLEVAKHMIKSAASAGAEMIKHQTHIVEDEMTEEAKSVFPSNADMSIWELMEQTSLSTAEEEELKNYTEALGVIYISTPFSRKAAEFLGSIDVPAFKIGSGECTHIPLIKEIVKFRKPVILSTGMQTIEGIRPAVQTLNDAGVPFALLQCTNIYPSCPDDVSLKGMADLREAFPQAVIGFSDHSIGPAMSLGAVGAGASIIERHFTDTRYRMGPDISCSMDPAELKYLGDRAREIHTSLQREKYRASAEDEVFNFARSSVVADRDIEVGHVITSDDIWARRPGTGEIGVEVFDQVIGLKLKRSIRRNEQLSWSDFD